MAAVSSTALLSYGPEPDQGAPPVASVIIVNWNGREHLESCLESLAAQSFADFETIMVDNGSRDGSVALVKSRFPGVRLLELPTNVGFAAGNNLGLARARGKYIVTLNNDTRVAREWLEKLIEVAAARPEVGMVGCRICSFADPDLIDSIGMGLCRDGMSRGRFRQRRWSELKLAQVEEILLPSACAALYKREMLAEVGFFDDDFFAYAEDTDLGLRGRLAGWSALAATQAVVYHKYSQSAGALSPFKVYLVERNHYWVAIKNFPVGWLAGLPLFTVWRYLEQLQVAWRGSGTGGEFIRAKESRMALIRALLAGLAAGVAGFPSMLGKRRRLQPKRRISRREFAALIRRHRISFRELLDNG